MHAQELLLVGPDCIDTIEAPSMAHLNALVIQHERQRQSLKLDSEIFIVPLPRGRYSVGFYPPQGGTA